MGRGLWKRKIFKSPVTAQLGLIGMGGIGLGVFWIFLIFVKEKLVFEEK
jgi:hypothetical protein